MNRRIKLRLVRWIAFCGLLFILFSQPGEWLNTISDCIAGPSNGTRVSGDSLQATVITPHLQESIVPGRNLLWCGTFQLAWNECIGLTGGPLRFEPDLPLATQMNGQEFTRKWVDETNTVAIAGFVRDDIYGQIERALRSIASTSDYARYKPDRRFAIRPQDIVAYAYLQTDITFSPPFENLGNQLKFLHTPVLAFGIDSEGKPGQMELFPQVWVHEYKSQTDFVVELFSTNKSDRLILARVLPGETLMATVQAVEKRLIPPPASRNPADRTGRSWSTWAGRATC